MKTKHSSLFFAILFAFSLVSCSQEESSAPAHKHIFVQMRDEKEHYQICGDPTCREERFRGPHDSYVCDDCADFRVISFGFDEGGDTAHSDFAKEANKYFPEIGKEYGFTYTFAGTDWDKLDEDIGYYDLIMFLNDRPHSKDAQDNFIKFMEEGGAWMGFHSAAFSMVDYSKYNDRNEDPSYWSWYQDEFLGCGDYARNTWNPTSEPLRVETHDHCATENIEEDEFISAPCEWYGWEYDLFINPGIEVLLTLNPTAENPAGDNPDPNKAYEIWTSGHHPIAWSNSKYNMVYMNWGHNLQSYNNGKEGKKSETFSSKIQNQFMIDAMIGLTSK